VQEEIPGFCAARKQAFAGVICSQEPCWPVAAMSSVDDPSCSR
jgi:hypothetical protein